jgi:hypothetical protein
LQGKKKDLFLDPWTTKYFCSNKIIKDTSISLIYQVKEDEMGRVCSTKGKKRNAYRILVGNQNGKRLLGKPRCRWVDNIKMDLRGIGWDGMDWIDLA